RPGDRVAFTFVVGGDSSLATAFRRLEATSPRSGAGLSEEPQQRRAPKSQRLREGGRLPAFQLINQAGEPFTEEELRGKRTVLTFIFTRCPVPEFCPRMMSNFTELQRGIQSAPNLDDVQLASVTIDP